MLDQRYPETYEKAFSNCLFIKKSNNATFATFKFI